MKAQSGSAGSTNDDGFGLCHEGQKLGQKALVEPRQDEIGATACLRSQKPLHLKKAFSRLPANWARTRKVG